MIKEIIEVKKLMPDEWKSLSEDAHRICFNEEKPVSFDRIDYALLCVSQDIPRMYVTCREYDHETVYFQYGGAFPGTRQTVMSWTCFAAITNFVARTYKRVAMLIENTNTVMLKFAMKIGYRIIGVRCFAGSVLLEHLLEF